MKPFLCLAMATLSLGACTTGPSNYGPAPDGKLGFNEARIENDRFRVEFTGKSQREAQDLALVRAAELAVNNGYDYFQIVDGAIFNRGNQSSGVGTSVGVGVGSSRGRGYRRGYGRRGGSYTNVGVGINVNDVIRLFKGPRITNSIEVLMGRGTPPSNIDAYDARDVLDTIRPSRQQQ